MQAAAVLFYIHHAASAIIQQQAMPILGSENTTNTSTWQKVICLQYTVHLVVVRLNPLIEGFLVKSEPIEQRGGAATLECHCGFFLQVIRMSRTTITNMHVITKRSSHWKHVVLEVSE